MEMAEGEGEERKEEGRKQTAKTRQQKPETCKYNSGVQLRPTRLFYSLLVDIIGSPFRESDVDISFHFILLFVIK